MKLSDAKNGGVESTRQTVLFVVVAAFVILDVMFGALIVVNKPTIEQLNSIVPGLLTPNVALVTIILNYLFRR
jgi:hypothetical protein